ncbi:aminoglycoside adenylyltransferase domain-containing protein [Nonomuraea sp. LPB2021202275-12-8]|uniref:aminoglycoside adenylyltransferase domain-containing protein n=1 Tax=Nonomuraea sp. LPB2021202275-12-8 TaxID=3120159 RepID=UPI00300C5A83
MDHGTTRSDPDLAAHITVARRRGVTLLGPPAAAVFAPVPHTDYLAAILDDLAQVLDGGLQESPCYGVLNACRVLMVRGGGPGTVPSTAWHCTPSPPTSGSR